MGRPGQAPAGWRELLVAPLVAQGRHLGVIVLGNLRHDRHAGAGAGMRLGRQDLQLLSPLASGLAVTFGNATQVAQIKEEKSTLEQILGLSSDGILLLDGKGRVRVWNQAMERICGVAADDAVGLPYNELLAGHDHDGKLVRLEDLLAAATPERPRASAEVQIRTSEGLERWLRCNHSLLYEGGDWTTDMVIVHDVTRIRQAERAKTDFVAERADHLARLVEDLLLASRISSEPGGTAVVAMQRECTDLAEAARRAAATGGAAPTAAWSWSSRPGRSRSAPTPCGWSRCWPTSSPTPTSTPRPTRRCGCGCGATAAGRWRPWPTGAGASPARSWTGCSRSSTGSRTR